MLYLKYRPKIIEEIDNIRIKEELKNILSSQNIPHAYLFVGQKGTGKTSTARIFAKAVNCLNNKFSKKSASLEPCNKCSNCLSIISSSSPDVLEIDAASNRGIDEIRSLIKESSFLPMTGRYRVFIIDEVHMITHDAFNALLKTLEEPPQSVIFILATTNLEKVPKTIISRCLFLNFGKAKKEDIKNMLNRVIKSEKTPLEDDLLDLIIKHSENSFRDATKLLEELSIQNIKTFEEAKSFLGLKSKKNFLEIIETKNITDAIVWLEEFIQNGGSIKNLIVQILEELRLILLLKNGIKIDEDINSNLQTKEIIKLMKLMNRAYEELKYTPIESIPLEVAIVEFYNYKNSV